MENNNNKNKQGQEEDLRRIKNKTIQS